MSACGGNVGDLGKRRVRKKEGQGGEGAGFQQEKKGRGRGAILNFGNEFGRARGEVAKICPPKQKFGLAGVF
jgi:hypothetical protein